MENFVIYILEVEALLFICLMAGIFTIWRQHRSCVRVTSMNEDIFNTPGLGILLFDEHEAFFRANHEARDFLSLVVQESGNKAAHRPETLRVFWNYMFDYAVEPDESLKNALDKLPQATLDEGFREVISLCGESLYLIDAYKSIAGRHMVNIRDISAAKREQDSALKLNDYSHKITHAIEAATNGILIAKRAGDTYHVTFANKAFYTQSGLPAEFVANGDAKQVLYEFFNLVESQDVLEDIFENMRAADIDLQAGTSSKVRWFNLKLMPIQDGGGGDDEGRDICTVVLSDITDLKNREIELFKAQKMEALGQLAAGVAHDFNNILSIIGGYARIADTKVVDDFEVKQYLQKIQTSTERGAHLTAQLLTFSRHKIVTKNAIDLSNTIHEQAALFQPLIPAHINLSIDAPQQGIAIECAPEHITQILMNLIVNACDAMPDGGQVNIGAHLCEAGDIPPSIRKNLGGTQMVRLHVSDAGQGMDRKTAQKLFEPFFTTKAQGKGTGLGMFIVYGLVKQMDGYIDVCSSPGDGTTMSMFFPLSNKQILKQRQQIFEEGEPINLEGYTALVAEDEEDLLLLVQNTLENLGMQVIGAHNGNDALIKQDDYDGKIDLLLTDVAMPELDGIRLAELFKSQRPEADIVFMSGYPANGKIGGLAIPEDSLFMAKPLKHDVLARVVFEVLTAKDDQYKDRLSEVIGAHWETSDVVEPAKVGSAKALDLMKER